MRLAGLLVLGAILAGIAGEGLAQRPGTRPSVERTRTAHERMARAFETQEQMRLDRREYEYRLSAARNHEDLTLSTKANARQWIAGLTSRDVVAHLQGLPAPLRSELGVSSPSIRNLRPDNAGAHDIAPLREAYVRVVEASIDASNKELVGKLSDGEKRLLREFARERTGSEVSLATLQIDIVDKWVETLVRDGNQIATEFPLLDAERRREVRTPVEFVAESSWRGDANEGAYRQRAVRDALRQLGGRRAGTFGAEQWQFRNANPHGGFEPIWAFLNRLTAPLPGAEPRLVYFLDRVGTIGATEGMSRAWSARGGAEPRFLEHADVDRFLAEFTGQTVLLVGHIEHRHFVLERGRNHAPLRIDLPELTRKALERNVFLLPIGCNSATAGALFGFTRPVSSGEVARLLQAVPRGPIAIGDLLAAFNRIGSISVDVHEFDRYVEIVVRRTERDAEEGRETAVVVTRLPIPASAAEQSFSAFFDSWQQEHRPWLDRGALRHWRAVYREWPILTLGASGVLLLVLLIAWESARVRVIEHTQRYSRFERIVLWTVGVAGGVLLAAAAVRFVVVTWPLLAWLVGGMVVLFLWHLVFDDSEAAK